MADSLNWSADQQKVSDRWSELLVNEEQDVFSSRVFWAAIPRVSREHIQKLVAHLPQYTGWREYCLGEFLGKRLPVANMLNLGCGTGSLERFLATHNAFQHCDAYDISPEAIRVAREQAATAGLGNVDYQVADVAHIELPKGHYDAIWFESSLHHIEPLEKMCREAAEALAPGGYVFINEYVGPSHFALTPRQKEVVWAAFTLIPERFRHSFRAYYRGQLPPGPEIPDPLEVVRVDPSEAVRSADIRRVVAETFQIVREDNGCGTVLQWLLAGIAGNFRAEDPESMRVLEMLLQIEDTLTAVGDLQYDFASIIAQAKPVQS